MFNGNFGKHRKKIQGKVMTIGKFVLSSIKKIAVFAMRGADPRLKFVVFACYGIAALGIILVVSPPYDVLKQLVGAGLAMAFLLAAVVMVVLNYRNLTPAAANGQHGEPAPRIAEPIEIPDATFRRVLDMLGDARSKARDFLLQTKPNLADGCIRANLFFPKYDPAGKRDDYVLKIWLGLHLKMDRESEINIEFKPGQGATGLVFESGRPRVAKKLDSEDGDWDEVFKITGNLAAIIHPDLKWIVSMPLKDDDEITIGVLNIDGICEDFDRDLLYECMVKVTDSAVIIHDLIIGNR